MSISAQGVSGRGQSRSARVHGVDLARGLAVVGMLAAHLLNTPAFDAAAPETWIDLVNGRSSILFAVLAGVSLALSTGAARPPSRLGNARRRIAIRAAVLWIVGIALVLTGVPVLIILPAYAILFMLALPALGLRAPALWVITALLAVIMPFVHPYVAAADVWQAEAGVVTTVLAGWAYPFTVWIAFVFAGLAIGRSGLSTLRVQLWLLGGGAVLAVTGYAAEASAARWADTDYLAAVWTARAHSSGLLEVIGSGGFAVAVLGACLVLCRTPLVHVAYPVRAVGSMPLTAYVGQLIAWVVVALALHVEVSDLLAFRSYEPFWWFTLATLLFCTVWSLLWGRGPLERALAFVARLGDRRSE